MSTGLPVAALNTQTLLHCVTHSLFVSCRSLTHSHTFVIVQGRMLDELDEDVDTTHSRLRATQKKVRLMGACRKCRRAAGVAWVVGRGALHTAGCAQHKKRGDRWVYVGKSTASPDGGKGGGGCCIQQAACNTENGESLRHA